MKKLFKNINNEITNSNLNIEDIFDNSFVFNKNPSSLNAKFSDTIKKIVLNPLSSTITNIDFLLSQRLKKFKR